MKGASQKIYKFYLIENTYIIAIKFISNEH
nr:MAG TPA: hypothetical protein [Caudoviricetes sp.]DAY27431.1 MAG TPA: hypothetical protein [Caudoviricetes sp.]